MDDDTELWGDPYERHLFLTRGNLDPWRPSHGDPRITGRDRYVDLNDNAVFAFHLHAPEATK